MDNHINHKMLLLVSCMILLIGQSVSQNGSQLFDPSYLHEIRIYNETTPDLWDAITREYVSVNLTIDGNMMDSVGLKLKGSTSVYDDQKPLVLDFNWYVKGQEYDGLKKVNLRNNFKDPTLQRERLAYEMYRRAGLPSPRTSYAEIYVNDDFRGIYTLVEMIDKTFLKHYFPSNDGSLYKGDFSFSGFKVELKEGTMDAFDKFERYNTPLNLKEYVNLDDYLKQMAVDIITGDWDSYAYHRHNFYIYHEPRSGLLNFINWDHNYAFRAKPEDQDLHPKGTFPSEINLIESPNLKSEYEETMCELLTYVADSSYIGSLLSKNCEIINSNNNEFRVDFPEPIIQYVCRRVERLQDTLSTIGVTCEEESYPFNQGDLVINEIAISSDAEGKSERWIELANNSKSEIIVDKRFYLSDDRQFLKKWNFDEEMVIPPGEYLTIWADDKVNRQGPQTGFKLKKSGGELFLTFEDLTVIQEVKYGAIKKDQGFARVPNGKGEFDLRTPTFNATNNQE